MTLRVAEDTVVRLALEPVDFRRSIDGLARTVGESLGRSPVNRELFLFTNRRHTAIKALYWTPNGFVMLYKRLEKARFGWPRSVTEARDLRLRAAVLQELLDGATRCVDSSAIMPKSQ